MISFASARLRLRGRCAPASRKLRLRIVETAHAVKRGGEFFEIFRSADFRPRENRDALVVRLDDEIKAEMIVELEKARGAFYLRDDPGVGHFRAERGHLSVVLIEERRMLLEQPEGTPVIADGGGILARLDDRKRVNDISPSSRDGVIDRIHDARPYTSREVNTQSAIAGRLCENGEKEIREYLSRRSTAAASIGMRRGLKRTHDLAGAAESSLVAELVNALTIRQAQRRGRVARDHMLLCGVAAPLADRGGRNASFPHVLRAGCDDRAPTMQTINARFIFCVTLFAFFSSS